MFRTLAATAALALLTACGDGQPFEFGNTDNGGTPTPGPTPSASNITPLVVAQNLYAIAYNPDGDSGAGTLRVDIRSLDASILNASYLRVPGRDIPGYRAFEYQENPNSRKFLAFVREAPNGTVTAAAVADGGQFNRYFGGGFMSRSGTYSEPTITAQPNSGIVRYAGTYAGVITVDTSGNVDYAPDAAPPSGNYPHQPSAVTGEVLIVADFQQNRVNGGIINREIESEDGTTVLPDSFDLVDIALIDTEIPANGQFVGIVEARGGVSSGQEIGDYAGVFGGIGATDLAGVILINPYPSNRDIWEHGIFVIQTCTTNCPAPNP